MYKNKIFQIPGIWNYDPTQKVMTPVWGHKYHIIPHNSLPFAISFAILILILAVVADLHLNLVSPIIETFCFKLSFFFIKFSVTSWFYVIIPTGPFGRFSEFMCINPEYLYTNWFLFSPFFFNFSTFFTLNLIKLYETELEFLNIFFDNFSSILNEANLTDFSRRLAELEQDSKKEEITNNILSITQFSTEIEINSFKKDCFFILENFKNIGFGLYIHWGATFLLTLGVFFVWCSKAIEEGSFTKITTNSLIRKTKNSFSNIWLNSLFHSNIVRRGFKIGFILFIVSEVMFFFGFFWAFFHSSLSPSIQIGAIWPPVDIDFITVKGFAIANTVILLTSGMTLTVAHYALELLPQKHTSLDKENRPHESGDIYQQMTRLEFQQIQENVYNLKTRILRRYKILGSSFILSLFSGKTYSRFYYIYLPFEMFLTFFERYFFFTMNVLETEKLVWAYVSILLNYTILLAFLFMIFQGVEYFISPVNIDCGVYGSTFYMTTGLHGAHVFIGTCFLMYCKFALSETRTPSIIINFYQLIFRSLYTLLIFFGFNKYRGKLERVEFIGIPRNITAWYYGKLGIESFECAAWYWHFVDVVWIFVFAFIYVWSHATILDEQ